MFFWVKIYVFWRSKFIVFWVKILCFLGQNLCFWDQNALGLAIPNSLTPNPRVKEFGIVNPKTYGTQKTIFENPEID